MAGRAAKIRQHKSGNTRANEIQHKDATSVGLAMKYTPIEAAITTAARLKKA
jgi:hypothetical protein